MESTQCFQEIYQFIGSPGKHVLDNVPHGHWSVSCMQQSVFISQGTTCCCICICLFSCMKHLIGFPISVARLTLSPLVSLIYHAKCSRTRVNNSPAFLGFLWQGLFKNIAGPYTHTEAMSMSAIVEPCSSCMTRHYNNTDIHTPRHAKITVDS